MASRPAVIKSSVGPGLCVGVWVMSAIGLTAATLLGGPGQLARFLPLILLLDFLVWIFFWTPCVRLDDDALLIVNPFRAVRIPWAAVAGAASGPLLVISTPRGTFKAWGVPGFSGGASAADVAQDFELNMYRATPDDSIGASMRDGTGSQTPSVVAARQIERMREIHGQRLPAHAVVGTRTQVWQLITVGALLIVAAAVLTL